MATSSSYNYNRTAEQVITSALRKIGKVKNDTAKAPRTLLNVGREELNDLIKHLHNDGLQMWKREQATLFQQVDTNTYSLGPSGDHATASYVKTEIATAASETDTTIDVDSITGISNGDYIGVKVDDGTIHWTTVNGAPSGSTITLTDALDDDAAVDNEVYAYTTKIQRPLKILDIWRHYDDGSDNTIDLVSISEYSEMTTKTRDGVATMAAYQPTLTNGKLYVWSEPDDVTVLLQFWYQKPIEDVDSLSDDLDIPQEWYLALVYNLALLLADNEDGLDPIRVSRVRKNAMLFKEQAMGWDNEDVSIFLEPDTRNT